MSDVHQHHPQSVPIVRHFSVQERADANPFLMCWCGASLEVDYSYEAGGTSQARSRLNLFLDRHECCQPKGEPHMNGDTVYPNPNAGNINVCGGVYMHGFSQPVPLSGTVYSSISPQDMDAIRLMIREEVHKALHPESESSHD